MTELPAWGDFIKQLTTSRDSVVKDLIRGIPNRYNKPGDNEKRAMIHAFNLMIDTPVNVKRDAEEASKALTAAEAQRSIRRTT